MKNFSLSLILLGMLLGPTAKGKDNNRDTMEKMLITIGQKTFTATLEYNATAAAFKAMLPLKLKMEDLNANEKVISLPAKLPTKDANPRQIKAGDLMIWTSRSLVLFYKSFPTSYSYTRLGRIDDPTDLAAALGEGDVPVSFELIPL